MWACCSFPTCKVGRARKLKVAVYIQASYKIAFTKLTKLSRWEPHPPAPLVSRSSLLRECSCGSSSACQNLLRLLKFPEQSIRAVYTTLCQATKDTLTFNFKLAPPVISQYVLWQQPRDFTGKQLISIKPWEWTTCSDCAAVKCLHKKKGWSINTREEENQVISLNYSQLTAGII